jgi:hypothetical protein
LTSCSGYLVIYRSYTASKRFHCPVQDQNLNDLNHPEEMKGKMKPTVAILALAALLGANPAHAADEAAATTTAPPAASHAELAAQATNPLALLPRAIF